MPIFRRFAVLPVLTFALSAAFALAAEMSREELQEMEDLLARLGFPPGAIDGTVDDKTRDAIAGYQDFAALPGDPQPSRALLEELRGVVGQVEELRRAREEETDEDLGDFAAPSPEPTAEVSPTAATDEEEEPGPSSESGPAVAALTEPTAAEGAADTMPAVEEPAIEEPAPAASAAAPDPLPVEPAPEDTVAEELAPEESVAEEPAAGGPEAEEPATVAAALAEPPLDPGETAEPVPATEATAAGPELAKATPEDPPTEDPPTEEPAAVASVETMQTETALVEEVPEETASWEIVSTGPAPEKPAPEEAMPEAPSPEVAAAEPSVPEAAAPEEAVPEEPPTEAAAAVQSAALPTPAPEPEPEPAPGPSAAVLEKARIAKALAPYQSELSSGELSYGDLARNFNEQGRSNFNGGRYDQALGDFDTAIYLQPNFAAAYHNRAKVYQAMGDAAKAQQDFDKAFDLGFTRLNLQ